MELADLKAYRAMIENIEFFGKVCFSYVPFSCPDALVAILADFILSLVEVEVAVICSFRENGIKLSVRSEDPHIHAGDLLHTALEGLGSGGGHASMAGGFVSTARLPDGDKAPKDQIRDLLLKNLGRL